ncbi:MAG: DUF1326 domain-containing protein [Acidobacteria bacterium]|nr:DUF1326 domain-containing protein [Acidobacteriota bacterium]MBI3663057.1 DUF1326 domain-containing protein [Acidobacteriota bacterium]
MNAKRLLFALALAVVTLAAPAMAQVHGDYIEVRTADVYTGPCFANGEVGLTGHDAVLAWRVEKGAWEGVALDGLSVVAVVRASSTLGDPYSNPLPAKAVMIVDERANEAQRTALTQFAQAQTADLLKNIVAVEVSPIRFAVDVNGQHGYATLEAGNLARISTRTITSGDSICHNEEVFYQPLAGGLMHAMPAVAVNASYQGNHLGGTWKEAERRGAFVGMFSR